MPNLRRLDPVRTPFQILFFRFWYWVVMLLYTLVYRVRLYNTGNVPDTGGLLVIANHQSHLDPPLVGIGIRRRNIAPIAREGLFRVPLLGWLLRGLGCIAIKEEEGDAGAIRKAIAALKEGRVVVIFPEGSRTPDGQIKEFKRGMWILMSRAGVPVLPAAVEGCYDAWPRRQLFPKLFGYRVGAIYGEPIAPDTLKKMGADAGLAMLRDEVGELRSELGRRLNRVPPQHVPA